MARCDDEEVQALVDNDDDFSLEDEASLRFKKAIPPSTAGIRFQYALMAAAVVIVLVLSFTAETVELESTSEPGDVAGKYLTSASLIGEGLVSVDFVADDAEKQNGLKASNASSVDEQQPKNDEEQDVERGTQAIRTIMGRNRKLQTESEEVSGAGEPTDGGEVLLAAGGGLASKSTDGGTTQGMKGFLARPNSISNTYVKRGKPISDLEKTALATKWGSWTFVDADANMRPKDDFYSNYPSRDVPSDSMPANAWQKDSKYLSEFVPQARALVDRAMEAILTEYGRGKFDMPDADFETRAAMFPLELTEGVKGGKMRDQRYIPKRSFDALSRRLLHAVMTEDTFTFSMIGHSASAGHGNLFQQSYTMQVQKVLEPVFARLGVHMTARNFGMGGLGTLQTGIGAGSIIGKDSDIVMWDSGMTEREPYAPDILWSQVILAGDRAPLIMNGGSLGAFFNSIDADVAVLLTDFKSSLIPTTESVDQAETMPWASRYHTCSKEMKDACGANKYRGECWVERDDYTPTDKIQSQPGGRAGWHPGDRTHQLQGRAIAFMILQALKQAMDHWASADDFMLDDSEWHMDSYIQNIKQKMIDTNGVIGHCASQSWAERLCRIPMQARTEFSPKDKPWATAIRTIMKGDYGESMSPNPNLYDPPDVFIPSLNVPEGVFEYLAVLENGVEFIANSQSRIRLATEKLKWMTNATLVTANQETTFKPGKGFMLGTQPGPNNCDATYDSFCRKLVNCPLYGANDDRGGIFFNGLSGWMVLNLENVRHGLVILKIEDWHLERAVTITEGWVCENGESDCNGSRGLESVGLTGMHRELKEHAAPYCEDFKFEFALDGKITTWDLETWQSKLLPVQRVVQIATVLDDPNYTNGQTKDVELAFRITGCGRSRVMHLTHAYWA